MVDLVFRNTGWIRVSVLGQHAKAYDLELREPITGDRYVVQVKSQATRADLEQTIKDFSKSDFRRVFFVVHSPAPDLAASKGLPEYVDLVPPAHLAELALQAGLSTWIERKVSWGCGPTRRSTRTSRGQCFAPARGPPVNWYVRPHVRCGNGDGEGSRGCGHGRC